MKKRERPSYAFLMEMMWVCAFFLICACIFVLAFAKAEQMSRKAETLNKATLAAGNAMEEIYAAFDDAVYATGAGTDATGGSSGTDATAGGSEIGTTAGSSGTDATAGSLAGFEAEAENICAGCSSETFTLNVRTDITDGLLTVVIEATDSRDGEVLCTLNGARAAAERRPS